MALDFLRVSAYPDKTGVMVIEPDFLNRKSKDIMTRGHKFYAIWDEPNNTWTKDEFRVQELVDDELHAFAKKRFGAGPYKILTMLESGSGMWKKYSDWLSRRPDDWRELDRKVIFSNQTVTKNDYSSFKLSYPLAAGTSPNYDKIMETLYDPGERQKIEWAIGSIISGDSKVIQKFIALYGDPGTGKGTVLDIIAALFGKSKKKDGNVETYGYTATFNAKSLGQSSNQFATAAFKNNPLVALHTDGDLSSIEDNSTLNAIISHETILVNEKHQPAIPMTLDAFLFLGTNKPVKITDSKSGLIRRLIDVRPSGRLIPAKEYHKLVKGAMMELGAIAAHCLAIYREMGRDYYSGYRPVDMMYETDPFYNFVESNYDYFVKSTEGVSIAVAWMMYKNYCEDANIRHKLQRHQFAAELKDYFREFKDRGVINGVATRSVYSGFRAEKFARDYAVPKKDGDERPSWIDLKNQKSLFDDLFSVYPAQLAVGQNEVPAKPWDSVDTVLSDIDTSKTHYILPPQSVVVMDFDKKDETGRKSLELNIKAASEFPPTYAEVSRGEQGLHLVYKYTGDVSALAKCWDDPEIEIKVFGGKASLRRKLTLCNNIPIAEFSAGFPSKEKKEGKMIDPTYMISLKSIRNQIDRNLRKEVHPNTIQSVSMIKKILDDAYESNLSYDLKDEYFTAVMVFAMRSTHSRDRAVAMVRQMHFQSKDVERAEKNPLEESNIYKIDIGGKIPNRESAKFVIFDFEVFPNFVGVAYKPYHGGGIFKKQPEKEVVRIYNPTAEDINRLLDMNKGGSYLVSFNGLGYDNHIAHGILMGDTPAHSYIRSKRLIKDKDKGAEFSEARHHSIDLFDISATKKSLKWWETKLGIHHQECRWNWDEPVPEEFWPEVMDYCANDVLATEALMDYKDMQSDYIAREILAQLTNKSIYDRTNSLTASLIFGKDKHPQLVYPDLKTGILYGPNNEVVGHTKAFPEYEYVLKDGKMCNIYKGIDLGKGGWSRGDPGMYSLIDLIDVESMHPSTIIALNLFGEHTKVFAELVNLRFAAKHGRLDEARKLFGGRCEQYLVDEEMASRLAYALKIAINSVYGLTSAAFDSAFKDKRNVNNVVALRGALFICELYLQLTERGVKVPHVKVDSLKIANATKEILDFCNEFAAEYGYRFDHEAQYDRLCLLNDSVYVARYSQNAEVNVKGSKAKDDHRGKWTSTGTELIEPYVFKTLFSHEELEFDDYVQLFSTETKLYLDMNEELEDPSDIEKQWSKRYSKLTKDHPIQEALGDSQLHDLGVRADADHKYTFVGKTGAFLPIKPGYGGGSLVRIDKKQKEKIDSGYPEFKTYTSATGAKGYRWLETERVIDMNLQDAIDMSYYDKLAADAKKHIEEVGEYTFEQFVAEGPLLRDPLDLYSDELPF